MKILNLIFVLLATATANANINAAIPQYSVHQGTTYCTSKNLVDGVYVKIVWGAAVKGAGHLPPYFIKQTQNALVSVKTPNDLSEQATTFVHSGGTTRCEFYSVTTANLGAADFDLGKLQFFHAQKYSGCGTGKNGIFLELKAPGAVKQVELVCK